ncbi:MAG: cysteine--tRNA ligase [Clostridia bacterium]|nr:cysteine--tRNA ligase [Clostridia bacterium]
MKVYNTLTRKKEELKTIKLNEVGMYSCGPTVYDYAHIGNLRTYIFMDLLSKTLRKSGYKLNHVMNITDVGHLVSDEDDGEDKMQKAANREKKSPYEIANFYIKVFLEDLEKLNIRKPDVIARATEHIPEMIEYVKKIIDNGYGYETSSGIYFDISKLPEYGMLSGKNLEGEKAGARIEVDDEKKNSYDFAIWKKAPENHIMQWESPWGMSFPGWHLECSAMSRKYLGEQFDIHTGGVDHIPIHHENEIAQSLGFSGKIPANYWMHSEFLQVDNGKMSKSLGNIYTIAELEKRGYEALDYRYFCLTAHYRSHLNFTFEGLDAAKVGLERLRQSVKIHYEGNYKVDEEEINQYKQQIMAALNDDLDTSKTLSIVWEIAKKDKKSKQYAELLGEIDEVLGIDISIEKIVERDKKEQNKILLSLDDEIKKLISEREFARLNKDWAKSDLIRDQLAEKGFIVKDTKEGMKIERIK